MRRNKGKLPIARMEIPHGSGGVKARLFGSLSLSPSVTRLKSLPPHSRISSFPAHFSAPRLVTEKAARTWFTQLASAPYLRSPPVDVPSRDRRILPRDTPDGQRGRAASISTAVHHISSAKLRIHREARRVIPWRRHFRPAAQRAHSWGSTYTHTHLCSHAQVYQYNVLRTARGGRTDNT